MNRTAYLLNIFLEELKQPLNITSVQSIDEGFFGFYLAPMFNSVKRMGGDMNSAFGIQASLSDS